MPDTNELQSGQRVGAGRFLLHQRLGRGGMGEVWLARDEKLEELVALKFLSLEIRGDPAALQNLRSETARSHRLTHSHIVRIHDLHEDASGLAFISMEYVEGPRLDALRLQQPSLVFSWPSLRPVAAQLCSALTYAHSEKVIHRDLKPSNIMLDGKGRLKLADFGIAAVLSDSISRISGRAPTTGTLLYMSPQQLAGKRPQVTDDIYSAGATLYELLTSQPPFHSGDITHQVLNETPEPLEERLAGLGIQNEVPAEVSAAIMTCLAKESAQRLQSAAELAKLLSLQESGQKPSHEPSRTRGNLSNFGVRPQGKLARVILPIVVIVSMLAVGIWYSHERGSFRARKAANPDPAVARFVSIPIPSDSANARWVPPAYTGHHVFGGVPFDISESSPNTWSAQRASGPNPRKLIIPVNLRGVAEIHTLMVTLGRPGTRLAGSH